MNTSSTSIELSVNEFYMKIHKYYYDVCAELMSAYLPSFISTLCETSIISLVKSKLECCGTMKKSNVRVVELSLKLQFTEEKMRSDMNEKNFTFSCCNGVESKDVKSTNRKIFDDYNNLESITIPKGVKCIKDIL